MKKEIKFDKEDLKRLKDIADYLLYCGGNSDFMVENRDFLIELRNNLKDVV
jgi:hypothetical protein